MRRADVNATHTIRETSSVMANTNAARRIFMPKVIALVYPVRETIGATVASPAQMQESCRAFRASGKPARSFRWSFDYHSLYNEESATFMYEHRTHHLLDRTTFATRVARHAMLALCMLAFSLGLGVMGYHYLGELGWIDALLNASMILTGMGPVDILHGVSAKLFASLYALFSGIV